MPRIAYSLEKRAEVIATASIAGAEFASERHGLDVRTVRRWLGRAGKAPADAIGSADWTALGELARAKVAAALTSGKVSAVQAATIAGIADRNAAKPMEPEAPPDPAEKFVDLWMLEIDATYPGKAGLALIALLDGSTEDDPRWDDPLAYLADLGDLEEWRRRRQAEQHAAMERQLEANRQAAAEWARKSMDDETAATVAAAELFLRESAT